MTPGMTVAPGLWTLAGSGVASVAAVLLPSRRAVLGIVAATTTAVAATLVLACLVGQWREGGVLPHPTWFEARLLTLAGLSLATTLFTVRGALRVGTWSEAAPWFRAAAAAAILGTGLAGCALGNDTEPALTAPAVQTAAAGLHYALLYASIGLLLGACAAACAFLLGGREDSSAERTWDGVLHSAVSLGLPLLLVSIVVGAVWHGRAWADPWGWDVGETWSLATILLFVVWLHLRQADPAALRPHALLLAAGGGVLAGWLTFVWYLPAGVDSMEYY